VNILGISAYYHDSAAALVRDGHIAAAAQEERFTRKKHDSSFPQRAIRACLDTAGIPPEEIDWVVFYDKPFLKFERLVETYLAFAPRGFSSFRMAMPLWLKEKLFQKRILLRELKRIGNEVDWASKLLFTEHHLSHAASAFFPSPFEEAAILTMDGVGEWASTSAAIGKGNMIELFQEIHFPHSLGLLYSAFTYYTGFKVNSGEYKLMGLAPYGEPKHVNTIFEHLIDLKADGSFRLNLAYFDYCTGLTMTNARFDQLFGAPRCRVGPGCAGTRGASAHTQSRPPNRYAQPVPCGRRGAQLCRQRQGVARRPFRQSLDSTGGGRCRRRNRRGPGCLSPVP
jgi:carbamoyltransferase